MKDQTSPDQLPPIEVPHDALSPETTKALIESFILREGTDYGRQEVELSTKMEQVERQLKAGKIRIVFDPGSESVTLMTESDWKKFKSN